MRFGILGPIQVWGADGRALAVGGPRLRALLARLLVDPGQVVGAERLIDDLYGERPPAGAANALQSQVSRLRRVLQTTSGAASAGVTSPAGPSLVELHPAGYALAVDPADVDAHQFTRLAAQGRRALAGGDHPRAAAVLREALDLWRGPALADVTDAPFAPAHAAHLAEARLVATEERIEADLALGGYAPLVAELRELVAAHPLRERLYGQLMRALYGSGRQAEALRVFEEVRTRLADELGADPSPELAAVHVAVLRHDAAASGAPGGAAAATPHPSGPPLPAQLTSFVGREEELRRVGKLLGEGRLVTLTGPGGCGKTRLAVEAAGRHPEQTHLVELAALTTGSEVPAAVLAALGLRDAGLRSAAEGGLPLTERLTAALADRRLLLVLDNCEHLVSAAAELVDTLLGACPLLRVLATSREPLGLTGEALFPLAGLALPPPDVEPEQALAYPAVRLFADRACDSSPLTVDAVTGDAVTGDAVHRICRTLDGLPLAIELAAARLRSLSVAEVASRLDDRFALLSRGSRTAQPRHRTLRAVVAWSWELLDEPEQVLARRLAGFAGGATLAAIEQVAGVYDVVDVLAGLVDKSLVEAEAAGERYRMLETVRAFGVERLAEAGETEWLRRAHAAYYLDLAWTADPHLRRAEQVAWLRTLDAERDNLNAALHAAVGSGELETALELVAALSWYWWLRGGDQSALAHEVLDAVGPVPPDGRDEEYALCVLNAALGGSGDPQMRRRAESVAAAVNTRDRPPRQPALHTLRAFVAGPPEDVDAVTERQVELAGDDPWSKALGPLGVGYMRMWQGRAEEAEAVLTTALAGFRALGERWGMVNTLAALGEVADHGGDRTRSVALIDEALHLAGELAGGEPAPDTAELLRLRGDCGVRAGDLDGAHDDYRRAAAQARRAGSTDVLAQARLGLAEVARLRGDLAGARELGEAALADCPSGWFTAENARCAILVALGRIAEAVPEVETARTRYRQALAVLAGLPSMPVPAGAVEGLLRVELPAAGEQRAAVLRAAATALLGSAPVAALLGGAPAGATMSRAEAFDALAVG